MRKKGSTRIQRNTKRQRNDFLVPLPSDCRKTQGAHERTSGHSYSNCGRRRVRQPRALILRPESAGFQQNLERVAMARQLASPFLCLFREPKCTRLRSGVSMTVQSFVCLPVHFPFICTRHIPQTSIRNASAPLEKASKYGNPKRLQAIQRTKFARVPAMPPLSTARTALRDT